MQSDREKLGNLAKEASRILTDRGVVCYPTETVYGLGGSAFDEQVVRKIFQIKGRAEGKPLIILVKDFEMAKKYVDLGNYEPVLKKYWPGPLTGVFKSKFKFPAGIISKEGTIALRISPHPFAQKLFEFIDFPLISTSANKSGGQSCRTVDEVKVSLGIQFKLIDFIADFGPLPLSETSTIVDFTSEVPKVLRSGAVDFMTLGCD